ncbi:hypothetical protein SBRCBS47491_004262 [Sporothrix bragantina]|uniref:NADP-dependent oxidoreductase domain-containing protein n=1 Tax=Sporothrix bragantina TaxID=671064 RepID=A0ABP0BLZ5_9PEZI
MDDKLAVAVPGLYKSRQDTKVSYTALGSSGLKISVPVFGTASFGDDNTLQPWLETDENKFMEMLKAAYDRGMNTWDTANVYSGGWNERVIGKALQKYNIPRNKVVILTKCFGMVGEEAAVNDHVYPWMAQTKDYVNQGGLSRAAIFNAVNASLQRLQTPYIDILQIHRYDSTVRPEETMKALHDLVQSGKVRYIGASSMWTYQFQHLQNVAERHNWTRFICMQNHYSLCYREEEREMMKYCKETGVGVISWSPMYRGLLARPIDYPETVRGQALKTHPAFKTVTNTDREIIKRVQEVAEKKGWKMMHVAYSWMVQKGSTPITGLSTIERLDDAVHVTGKVLSQEEMQYLDELYEPKPVAGHR